MSKHIIWKKITPIIVLISLFIVALAPAQAVNVWTYYFSTPAPDKQIRCSNLSLNAGGATLSWILPNDTSTFEVILREYVNGSLTYEKPANNFGGGNGSIRTGISSASHYSTDFPYIWARTFEVVANGISQSTSMIEYRCDSEDNGFLLRNEQFSTPPYVPTEISALSALDSDSAPAADPVPGPDMVPLPEGAVVGTFTSNTPLFYQPDPVAASSSVMSAGQSVWVAGVDESGAFYKVLLSGNWLWAPVETLGPTYDAVWNGAPLPVQVAE